MIEITGNIFDVKDADAICCTVNGIVKNNGELVMGKGIALEFAKKFPTLPKYFGKGVQENGNQVQVFDTNYDYPGNNPNIVAFPTKHDWKDKSDIELIIKSSHELVRWSNALNWQKIVLTRPGCGLGGLDWETEVKPAIKDILDDRFYIITPGGK